MGRQPAARGPFVARELSWGGPRDSRRGSRIHSLLKNKQTVNLNNRTGSRYTEGLNASLHEINRSLSIDKSTVLKLYSYNKFTKAIVSIGEITIRENLFHGLGQTLIPCGLS